MGAVNQVHFGPHFTARIAAVGRWIERPRMPFVPLQERLEAPDIAAIIGSRRRRLALLGSCGACGHAATPEHPTNEQRRQHALVPGHARAFETLHRAFDENAQMRADLTERPIAVLGVAILNEAIQFGIDVGELTKVEIAVNHVYTFVTLDSSIVKFKQKKSPEHFPGSCVGRLSKPPYAQQTT
jgi:hypothetical protein